MEPCPLSPDAWSAVFPVALASVEEARLALQDFLRGSDIAERVLNRIEVVLEEVVSNVVRHGHGADRITLQAECTGGALHLTVGDNGPAFDPLATAEPAPFTTLGEATIGGQGIPLIKRLTQSAHYARDGAFNRLDLAFALA
ncbi:MAG TPA: ATP-binding protein [Novosphingobium sp.]